MGEIKIDLEKSKEKYNSIKIPEGLDSAIANAARKAEKERSRLFTKFTAAVAACLAFLIITVNASPAFASYMSRLPGLENLIKLIQFDKGLEAAVDNGFVQIVKSGVSDKGIRFTIENIILDKRTLLFEYTLEAQENYEELSIEKLKITDKSGEKIKGFLSWGSYSDDKYKDSNKKSGTFQLQYIDTSEVESILPEDIVVKCSSLRHQGSAKPLEGNWEVSIKLDKGIIKASSPEVHKLDKSITIEDVALNIDYLKLYPTVADVMLSISGSNRLLGLSNAYLEDEGGNKYNAKGAIDRSSRSQILNFESSYFDRVKSLKLVCDGAYVMPEEDRYVSLDLENKKILDDGGYSLQYISHNENLIEGEKAYLAIILRCTDPTIAASNVWGALEFDYRAYDAEGRMYTLAPIMAFDNENNKSIETTIFIEKSEKLPEILNLRVIRAYNYKTSGFEVKLK
jgi:hypothetical protein